MAATLIGRLPCEGDPERPKEEKVVRDLTGIMYVGKWWYHRTLNGWLNDSCDFITLLSAGADTVSKINGNIVDNVTNCMIRPSQS